MSSSNNQIVGNGHSNSNGNSNSNSQSGPWTFVCGKCPREFQSRSARDTHHGECNRPTGGSTRASNCLHDNRSFPTGTDSG